VCVLACWDSFGARPYHYGSARASLACAEMSGGAISLEYTPQREDRRSASMGNIRRNVGASRSNGMEMVWGVGGAADHFIIILCYNVCNLYGTNCTVVQQLGFSFFRGFDCFALEIIWL
jgi:hypothetical protein